MVVFFALGFGLASVLNDSDFLSHHDPTVHANVYFHVQTPLGVEDYQSGNVMTTILENDVRDWMGFGNQTSLTNSTKWISLGNATTISAALTKLPYEATTGNFSRNGTGTNIAWYNTTANHYAFNVTFTWYCTATVAVNATGLHWDNNPNSNNNMAACAWLTDGTIHQFTATSNCTVTWCITFVAS
jgi:hypothetical protein